jgi:hypothetical protein
MCRCYVQLIEHNRYPKRSKLGNKNPRSLAGVNFGVYADPSHMNRRLGDPIINFI